MGSLVTEEDLKYVLDAALGGLSMLNGEFSCLAEMDREAKKQGLTKNVCGSLGGRSCFLRDDIGHWCKISEVAERGVENWK